jgi:DNA-binding response OmpR family regulator
MVERWLVIDDSSTIQRVIKLAFQGYDVHINEADSCQGAAREIMQGQPALIIADAALGGVQGVQDFLALKAQAPQTPFIILEGSYDNIDEAQFRGAGFRHFLKKPFDAAQLLSVTRQALGRALPYRGEASVAMAQPKASLPPPPVRSTRSIVEDGSRSGSSFPPESTHTGGFDLGLTEHREFTTTQISQHTPTESRSMAQTILSSPAPMNLLGNFARKESASEPVQKAMSFSLEDDGEPLAPPMSSGSAFAARETSFGSMLHGREAAIGPLAHSREPLPTASSASRESLRISESTIHSASWDGLPRASGSHLGNLLEPMLQEEMEKLVRIAVEDYCRKNFAGIARELIQRELDRLTQDRSRLLID